jgi:hypothetical protein
MALAIYEGTKKDQLVDKIVDEEILRLLGLENVNDLDYDDYKTLLKERMAAGRMPGNNIPTEDTQKLTEEFKRVKKETGKFKVKNNKIKFNSVVGKATKKSRPASNPTKTLMGSSVEPEEEVEVGDNKKGSFKTISSSLSKIENSLENILGSLTNQQKLQSKDSERGRVSDEKEKKKQREEKSENSIFKKLGAGAKKLASPIGDIFETIKNFFMGLLGGILALGLIDLFRDPKKFFIKLVNDNADFFNGILQSIHDAIIKPINSFIDIMNDSIFDGFVSNLNKALNFIDFLDVIPEIPSFNIPNIPLLQIEKIQVPEAEPEPMKAAGMDGGGRVTTDTGSKISSMGSDTQLVALTPGEVVMSKKAVDAYGADTLLGMNASAGGTNMPRMGMVPGYQGGGMVGASDIVSSMGFSDSDFGVFKNVVASIESSGQPNNGYGAKGGSGNHYDGKYQLGADAKTDGARYAGLSDPGHSPSEREKFRKDPQLQETLFAGFTKANHTYLMGIPEYKKANSQRKLQILGYAHNQGMGGAAKWMKTGVVGADGFGTKGTKYTDSIREAFRSGSSPQMPSPQSTPASIQSSTQRPTIGVPGGGSGGSSVVVAGGGGAQQQAPSSAGGGGAQSSAPMFSPIDQNNPDLLVIKSIYSIV